MRMLRQLKMPQTERPFVAAEGKITPIQINLMSSIPFQYLQGKSILKHLIAHASFR